MGCRRNISVGDRIWDTRDPKLVSGSWVKTKTDVSIEAVKTSSNVADDSFSSKTRSILYMDVSGWSKLAANDIHAYASKGLKALSHRLEGYDFINTWGDSIVATFESVKTAAEMALRIQEFFANSYPDNGVSSGLTCRVSLHLGEIICCRNALRNELDVFGEAVHVGPPEKGKSTAAQLVSAIETR
jgi:hypothetical protein